MPHLTLLRHGQSQWNSENRFTGWADVDLTQEGLAQIRFAARQLIEAHTLFDIAYTSVLKRCIRSQWVLLDTMDCMWLEQRFDWRLNERHYGALTGMLKSEAQAVYGEDAVEQWRRSYAAVPPAMPADSAMQMGLDRRYVDLSEEGIARAESLSDTVARVKAAWDDSIAVSLRSGHRVLVVAHGNSLRALIKLLENLSELEVLNLEVPNAAPIIYELDSGLKPVSKRSLPSAPQLTSSIL